MTHRPECSACPLYLHQEGQGRDCLCSTNYTRGALWLQHLSPHPTRPEVLIQQVPKVSYAFWMVVAALVLVFGPIAGIHAWLACEGTAWCAACLEYLK